IYIIYNDANENEYYILENRQLKSWDAGLPGSGLLVVHVDYDEQAWYMNQVNSTSLQRMTIIPADNQLSSTSRSLQGDPYPYQNNNSLTNSSTPAATLNNQNTDGTYFMNKPITGISKSSDGRISFNFMMEGARVNAIKSIAEPQKERIYSIDGRYVGKDINALSKGIYIVGGKKIVR
ncbi:MAG: peptidase, partial [Prevotella sp.]|nr:peptidase [Prevotella sp.]